MVQLNIEALWGGMGEAGDTAADGMSKEGREKMKVCNYCKGVLLNATHGTKNKIPSCDQAIGDEGRTKLAGLLARFLRRN